MDPKPLSSDLFVSPQLSLDDVAAAKARGFRAVIVNRPDGEEPGQPEIAAVEAAARAAGLGFAAIPVAPGKITDADVEEFGEAVRLMDGPVIAYCRTGSRAATLWALGQAPILGAEAVLTAAAAAGYDLSPVRAKLEASAANRDRLGGRASG